MLVGWSRLRSTPICICAYGRFLLLTALGIDGFWTAADSIVDDNLGIFGTELKPRASSVGVGGIPAQADNNQITMDPAAQDGVSLRGHDFEVFTVSPMQTPCRCLNKYAYDF